MKFTEHIYPGTIFTYAIGSQAPFPQYPELAQKQLINLKTEANAMEIARGASLFTTYCALCHASIGSGGGNIPDLGYSTK